MISLRRSILALVLALVASVAVDAGAQPGRPTTVILVRHAEKAAEPAADPPLSEAGKARADALVAALAAWKLDAVYVTATERTRQTGGPVAARSGVMAVVSPGTGTVGARADTLAQAIRSRHAGQRVLVVGHSNTLAPIIRALGGPALSDLCDHEYDSIFVMELPPAGSPAMLRARFGPGNPPATVPCATMRGDRR
jgi:broad specificity phosphatase PhoE